MLWASLVVYPWLESLKKHHQELIQQRDPITERQRMRCRGVLHHRTETQGIEVPWNHCQFRWSKIPRASYNMNTHLINTHLLNVPLLLPPLALLVGGFNPFQKYESKWVHLPQIGLKIKNLWVATTNQLFFFDLKRCQQRVEESPSLRWTQLRRTPALRKWRCTWNVTLDHPYSLPVIPP